MSKYMTTIGIDYGVTKWVLLNTCNLYDSQDCKRNRTCLNGQQLLFLPICNVLIQKKIFMQYPAQSFWFESPFPFLGSRDGTVSRALPPIIVHLWKISILPLQEEFIANSWTISAYNLGVNMIPWNSKLPCIVFFLSWLLYMNDLPIVQGKPSSKFLDQRYVQ